MLLRQPKGRCSVYEFLSRKWPSIISLIDIPTQDLKERQVKIHADPAIDFSLMNT
jgi:hypothetical protein